MVELLRHRQTKEAGTDMFDPKATASHLDSTNNALSGRGQSGPVYHQLRKWPGNAQTVAMTQSTKSLRSSPLRGSMSRETGSQLRG
jgi:hypothetical protein